MHPHIIHTHNVCWLQYRFQIQPSFRITFAWNKTSFSVEVEDEGNGFNPEDVPDPTAPENLLKDNGRGLFVSRQLLDEVRFEKAGNGMRVTMVKNLAMN